MSPDPKDSSSIPNLAYSIEQFAKLHSLRLMDGLLLAVSGGGDSTALMFACAELDIPLHAVYIDHRLRPVQELEDEWSLLSGNAARAGLSLDRITLESGEVDEYAAREGCGIEAAARALRYALLDCERRHRGLAYIAMGHTADDVAETMCVRFFQGSGVSGLHGIPAVRLPYIRPLLEVPRSAILSYLASREIAYSNDSSNSGSNFQRNRIRHRILPVIAEEFPSYRTSLIESSAYFEEEETLLKELSRERLSWSIGEAYAEIDALRFFSEPASLRIRSLLDLLKEYDLPASRIPRRFLAVKASAENSSFYHQGHGFSLERRGELLRFTPSVVFRGKTRYVRKVIAGESGRIGPVEFKFDLSAGEPGARGFRLSLPRECSEVIIRNRRIGDRIDLNRGERSLKSLFNGQKIPEQLRDLIPLVVVQQEITAVAASLYGFRDIRTRPEGESIPPGSLVLELHLVE